jgi:putative transposase
MNDTLRLTEQKVLRRAQSLLEEHLPLKAEGAVCTTDDLLKVLLAVATNTGTIESVCADWVGSPDAETIRTYFNEQLQVEDLPDLERRLNAALTANIPARVKARTREVAIDLHDRPYYGKTTQAEGLWVRGKAKDGTTRFYRVATAYVMMNYLRVTLALRFVLPDDDTVTLLDDLLQQVKTQGITIARLFLDRGFDGIAVMEYLTRRKQPALIACTIRGKTGGTRALCQGPRSYRTHYTFHGAGQTAFKAELAVCRVFTTAKRTGRQPRKVAWMIFILVELDWTPRQARREYRRRFGIESSYRCAGQVRGWTTSPNPAYRFLLIGLSFVLLNLWVHLRWQFTQVPRRGGRWLKTKLFELSRLVKFIMRALETHYVCVHEIIAPAAPRP